MGLNLLISLLRFAKFTAPLIAIAYFGTWLTLVYGDEETFEALDFLLGILPKIMDKILFVQLDINGADVSIGYVLATIVMIVISIGAIKILNILEKYQRLKDDKETQRDMQYMELLMKHQKAKEEKEKQEAKEKLEKEELEKINTFYALFNLKINYLNPENKNSENLQKLKSESMKLITNKLKEKYTSTKFVLKDKLFIIFNDFSILGSLIKDLIKLYKAIAKAGSAKSIKTDFIISFHASAKTANPKTITKTLIAINNLNYLNKIITTGSFQKKYSTNNENEFVIESIGTTTFENIEEGQDITEIDLYSINIEQMLI